jgi:hypothetical protein
MLLGVCQEVLEISFQISHAVFFHNLTKGGAGDGVAVPNSPTDNSI